MQDEDVELCDADPAHPQTRNWAIAASPCSRYDANCALLSRLLLNEDPRLVEQRDTMSSVPWWLSAS